LTADRREVAALGARHPPKSGPVSKNEPDVNALLQAAQARHAVATTKLTNASALLQAAQLWLVGDPNPNSELAVRAAHQAEELAREAVGVEARAIASYRLRTEPTPTAGQVVMDRAAAIEAETQRREHVRAAHERARQQEEDRLYNRLAGRRDED
jgi:hypothetical protein